MSGLAAFAVAASQAVPGMTASAGSVHTAGAIVCIAGVAVAQVGAFTAADRVR